MIGWIGFITVRGTVRAVKNTAHSMVVDFSDATGRGRTFAAVGLVVSLLAAWITGSPFRGVAWGAAAGLVACTLVYSLIRKWINAENARRVEK